MGGTRAFVFMAVVATVLAVEIGPLFPTPLPSPTNLTTNVENQNKTTESNTLQPSSIPILSVVQNDNNTSDKDLSLKKGRSMNVTVSDVNSSINSIHSNSTQNGDDRNKMDTKKSFPDLSDVSMDNDDLDLDFVSKSGKESPKKIEDDIKANLAGIGETRVLNKPSIMADDQPFGPLLVPAMASAKDVIETTCFDAGRMYKVGEKIERGCDEMCTCEAGGILSCNPRCSGPFLKRGSSLRVRDPLCNEKLVDDPCCSILVCAADTESSMCVSGNQTYSVGENFNEGCNRTCTCEEGGNVTCIPRCPVLEQRDDCVDVQDPKDSCCMLQLCDVSQDVDDEMAGRDPKAAVIDKSNLMVNQTDNDKLTTTELPQSNFSSDNQITKEQFPKITEISSIRPYIPISESMLEKIEPILSVSALPNGTVLVRLRNKNSTDHMVHLELSKDGGLVWKEAQLKGELILGLEDGRDYIIRSKETGMRFAVNVPKNKEENNISKDDSPSGCVHKGVQRAIDEEFHIGCNELCICLSDGKVECAPLVCPSSVGLDALDSTCVQWAPDPPDFKPHPPACCPPAMTCVSNGSCTYKGHDIPNWSEVPLELSGCEQRCFCESGSVECQAVCAPLTALPPQSLRCIPPERPAPRHPDGDKCCKEWACVLNDDIKGYNKNDSDKMTISKDKQNETEQNNLLPPPLFVTLPPDLHKVIEETFGDTFSHENKKISKPKYENTDLNKDVHNNGPYFTPNTPQYHNVPLKPDKGEGKRYEYPGPFADPNHKAQPPGNGLGSFPFIKKHKEKPYNPYEAEDPRDFMHYNNGPVSKDSDKKISHPNDTPSQQKPSGADEYHVNDPYLSGNPSHIPFGQNQNGAGPGFYNPSATKNQQDLLHILQQANNGNGNPNIINGGYLNQPGGGIYQNNGIPIRGNPGETIHVYTDGSPLQIEHILQHIQQTDGNPGAFAPYGAQPQRPRPPFNNDGNSSANPAPPGIGGLPNVPTGPGPLGAAGASGEGALQVVALEASSPTTLRLVFSLPSVMVGLQGRVQLRYTDSNNPDPSSWRLQEFAPPEDLLATPQLEFQLGSLQPDTLYKIQAAVVLRQLPYVPKSHVYTVRTLPLQEETTLPPVIPIEPSLAIGQVSPSTAQINWRSFTQDELLYIDGIQLRYREIDGKVFSGTPLIHRAVTTFQLDGLKPNTSYEVGIYFIPFLGQHTELQSANMARLITPPIADMYDWNVMLEVSDVTAWGLVLQWSGVPRPAERYVHVCRAVWRAEAARADKSSFSLPTRDAPPMANITGLTPGTRYRIWLELYLTNGKIKTSNVKDIMTKPGKPAPQEASMQEGKTLEGSLIHKGDYYSSLVAVGVLAALGAMTSLVLLLVLVRRHRTASAPICASATTPHNNAGHRNNGATLPPYDSPSYKIDLQQETMDL